MNQALILWTLVILALLPELTPALPPSPAPASIVVMPRPKPDLWERLTDADLDALYRTAWGEVRGQSREEQAAVVHVMLNRYESGRWGSLYDTLHARKQFSVWNPWDKNYPLVTDPKLPRRASFQRIKALCDLMVAIRAEGAADPTDGADHYHHGRKPYWAQKREGLRVGGALLYKLSGS